jgi:hypothetical protein
MASLRIYFWSTTKFKTSEIWGCHSGDDVILLGYNAVCTVSRYQNFKENIATLTADDGGSMFLWNLDYLPTGLQGIAIHKANTKNQSESRWPGLKNQSHLVGKTNRSSTSSIAFMSHQLKRILFYFYLFIYPVNQYTIDIGQVTKLILIGKNIYYR